MTYDEELKSRFIDAFGGAPQPGPDIHAADPDSLVDLTWSAGSDLTVRVSRSLMQIEARQQAIRERRNRLGL